MPRALWALNPAAGSMLKVRIAPGVCFRHLFDVHAARGRRDEGDRGALAIDQRRKIKFPGDVAGFFNIQTSHDAAVRTGLGRDQGHAEHARGFAPHVLKRSHDFHAAAFAAAAGMDLRLHHPFRTGQIPCRRNGFFDRTRNPAAQQRRPKGAKHLFGLIFVNIHRNPVWWAAEFSSECPSGKPARRCYASGQSRPLGWPKG